MPTAYEDVLSKFERSQQHIGDLKARWDAFRKSNPIAVTCQYYSELGYVNVLVDHVPELPLEFTLILGDALFNLRSSLDHLVCRIIEASGKTPDTHACFPIFETAKKFEAGLPRCVKGMGENAIEAVRCIHPYKAGNKPLWVLNRLNVIDKHRLLLTITSHAYGHTLSPKRQSELRSYWTQQHPGSQLPDFRFAAIPGGPAAFKAGEILCSLPISEAHDEMQFLADIAINEAEITENTPLLVLLDVLSTAVRVVIQKLVPYL